MDKVAIPLAPYYVPVVQQIEQLRPKESIEVQFLSGTQA